MRKSFKVDVMMRHFLSVVFSVVACSLSFMAVGDSCVIENPVTHNPDTWYFGIESGEATVWEVEPFSGDLVIPEKVTKDGTDYPVRYIYQGAFEYGTDFTSVTIPDSVREIGDYAFFECTQITNIVVPASVENVGEFAFAGCSSIGDVVLEDGVKRLSASSFANCTALTNLTLAAGLEDIGEAAFSGCSSLANILIPETVTHIGARAFEETDWLAHKAENRIAALPIIDSEDRCAIVWTGPEQPRSTVSLNGYRLVADEAFKGLSEIQGLMIGSALQYVGNQAFSGCSSLSEIKSDEAADIPSHVKQIGDGAFANCAALESLTVASSATAFGEGVFEGDPIKTVMGWRSDLGVSSSALESVTFSSGISEIPAGAFEGSSLESVEIPEGVTSIGARAFADSEKLKTVVLPESLKTIGEEAFRGCTSLEEISIPPGVESIGKDAFEDTPVGEGTVIGWTPEDGAIGDDVTAVVIADGVTEIPDGAFAGCQQLTSVVIPNSVKRIGYRAFAGCQGLSSIEIPDSVESIGNYAFSWCISLEKVILSGTTVLGEHVFEQCERLKKLDYRSETPERPVDPGQPTQGSGSLAAGTLGQKAQELKGGVWKGADTVGIITVKVGKRSVRKGVATSKVFVTVTGLDGKKKISKSVTVGYGASGELSVPTLTVKGWGDLTGLMISDNGAFAGKLGSDCEVASASVGGTWAGSSGTVCVDFSVGFAGIAGVVETVLLPTNVTFIVGRNGKWAFDKAAPVKIDRYGALQVGSGTLGALKLTYTSKTGLFKGSFKLYAVETTSAGKNKLRKYTVKVSGVVVDGHGDGQAVLNRPANQWKVTVE